MCRGHHLKSCCILSLCLLSATIRHRQLPCMWHQDNYWCHNNSTHSWLRLLRCMTVMSHHGWCLMYSIGGWQVLADERAELKAGQRQLRHEHVQLLKERVASQAKLAQLHQKAKDVQMLKFGQVCCPAMLLKFQRPFLLVECCQKHAIMICQYDFWGSCHTVFLITRDICSAWQLSLLMVCSCKQEC